MALAEQPAYEYMGLNIDMNFEELQKRHPNTPYQKTAETHSSYFWISAADAKNGIYAINLQEGKGYWPKNRAGVTPQLVDFKWLKLSFEKPDALLKTKPKTWEDSHYFRLPECVPILTSLIKRYGDPVATNSGWEEQIEWTTYGWESGVETMNLACERLQGKGISLAMELTLSKPK
ncbi:MAG: hypothetical protein HY799_02650 [Nitrosomonadales bacterium]|nr:hypothetical protein [Nitrosomonadales bacterium]